MLEVSDHYSWGFRNGALWGFVLGAMIGGVAVLTLLHSWVAR